LLTTHSSHLIFPTSSPFCISSFRCFTTYFYTNNNILMGQALWCCDCIWFTGCLCVGISFSGLCFNCWICIPELVKKQRIEEKNTQDDSDTINKDQNDKEYECCKCDGSNNGCGFTLLLTGCYCCIPKWLRLYSMRYSIGDTRGDLTDITIKDLKPKDDPK